MMLANSSLDDSKGLDMSCDENYLSLYWIHTVFPAYMYSISAMGIVLNLLVLLVFLLHKKPCTATEIYLSNMATADLFLSVLLPFWGKNVANNYIWIFGEPMCKIVSLFLTMNYNCSIFFLVLVCLDRFMALVHPLSDCKLRRRKYAKMSCAMMWCFSLLLNIPILTCRQLGIAYGQNENNSTTPHDNINMTCDWKCSLDVYVAHNVTLSVVAFVIPLVIISFCTAKIIQALRARPIEGMSNQNTNTERKVTILILAVLLAFLICWFPYRVQKLLELGIRLGMIEDTCKLAMVVEVCQHMLLYLGFFNSSLNPVLYVIVGKAFRKKMWEVLFWGRNVRKSSMQFNTSNTSVLSSQKLQVYSNKVI